MVKTQTIILTSAITLMSLFTLLILNGAIIVSDGDKFCDGTIIDPCISYINITTNRTTYIYNPEKIKLSFIPEIKDYELYIKKSNKWVDFYSYNKTTLTKGVKYQFKLVGYKNNPRETVKWSISGAGGDLDPLWYGNNATSDPNLWVNNLSQANINVEMGSALNVSANISSGTVCIDFNHPSYGVNYSCGSSLTSFIANVTYFRKTTLSNGSSNTNLTFITPNNVSFNISSHQLDEPVNLSFNLTGYVSGGTYPTGVKVYVNNTLVSSIGTVLTGADFVLTTFNDSTSSKNTTFTAEETKVAGYLLIPKTANITSNLSFNITGFNSTIIQNMTLQLDTYLDILNPDENYNNNYYIHVAKYGGISIEIGLLKFESNISLNSTINSAILHLKLYQGGIGGNLTINVSYVTGYWDSTWTWNKGIPTHNASTSEESVRIECGTSSCASSQNIYYNWSVKNMLQSTVNSGGSSLSVMVNGTINSTVYDYRHFYSQDYELLYAGFTPFLGINYTTSFPSNIWIETGSIDGVRDWNYTGTISSEQSVNFSASAITSYLSSCIADNSGFCKVPIYVYSQTPGIIQLKNISLNYTVVINPIIINGTYLSNYLNTITSISVFNYLGYCYQESANITNQNGIDGDCGLSYGGIYALSNNYIYINYTKPLGALNSTLWLVKHGFDTFLDFTNYTIPSSCWNYSDIINLRIYSRNLASVSYGQCYNGADWLNVTGISGPGDGLNAGGSTDVSKAYDGNWSSCVLTSGDNIWLGSASQTYCTAPFGVGQANQWFEEAMYWDMSVSTNIPIKFSSDTNGSLYIDDIKYDYKGGNKTYILIAHNISYSNNNTINLTFFRSRINKNLPYTWTNTIFFQPKSYNQSNISAYGQTPTIPLFNITGKSVSNNFNLSVKLNETFTCMNMTISQSYNKSAGLILTSSYTFISNMTLRGNLGLWVWVDLVNCNSSVKKYLQPIISFRSCCDVCEVCEN